MNKQYTKQCPECGKTQSYSNKYTMLRSKSMNTLCYSCRNTHREFTPETRKKLSSWQIGRIPPNKGIPMSDAQKKLISQIRTTSKVAAGTNNPMFGKKHSDAVKEKMRQLRYAEMALYGKDCFTPRLMNAFKYKDYTLHNGDTVKVQGYEPLTLNLLQKDPITIECKKASIPRISYIFEGETHTYYPDCFLPDSNTIVETKSPWTWNSQLEKNQAKVSASVSNGYDTRVLIWGTNKQLQSDVTYTLVDGCITTEQTISTGE